MKRRSIIHSMPGLFLAGVTGIEAADWKAGAEIKPNRIVAKDFSIVVAEAQLVKSKDGTQEGLALEYEYSFSNEKPVSIRGLGPVSSKGRFSYISFDKEIIFQQAEWSSPIVLALKATRQPEGGDAGLPSESDFGQVALNLVWSAGTSFFEHLSKVLNDEFIDGFSVRQVDGRNCYTTKYRALDNMPAHLNAEIAILVSYPAEITGPPVAFKLQYLVRQKPRRSDKWDYDATGLEEQVKPLLKKLTEKLQKA